jgi:hypothetical protein
MTIKNSTEFITHVDVLLERSEVHKTILDLAEKAYKSGGMETENIEPEDFSSAKTVLCAIFSKLSDEFKPFSKDLRHTAENLKKFI